MQSCWARKNINWFEHKNKGEQLIPDVTSVMANIALL
jgi:hypothetical protein